jgi:glycosyltransferase involved in cell wall biosynthesis
MQVSSSFMKIELSAVVPVYNEGPEVRRFIEALAETLAEQSDSWEIVVVDDGSREDGSIAAILEVAAQCRVRLVRFSRNFGKESALSAGLDTVRGDAAILIDADFQHPLATIRDFIRLWRGGAHMVYGVRGDRATDPALRRVSSKAFYRLFNWLSNIQLESGAGDFRLLDRKVINAINGMPERRRFMKGLYSWVGFRTAKVTYDVQPRAFGETKWGFSDLGRFAIQGIISFSEKPLRLLAYFGMALSTPALLYGVFIAFESLVRGNPVPGWPTIVTAVMFFGGLNLTALSLIGRYIGELFLEAKGRPAYILMSDEDFATAGHSARATPDAMSAAPAARIPVSRVV